MLKTQKIDKNSEEEDIELVKILKKDEKLREKPDEFRWGMLTMARLFMQDFANNMYKTSIELHSLPNEYSYYSIDAWKDFLNYPVVRKYIQSFKDEKINLMADQSLAQGDRGAVSIRKAMQEGGPAINNSNLILIRLPEKKEFDD